MIVTISGPMEVRKRTEGAWTGSVSGGIAPFTYTWFLDGVTYGSNMNTVTYTPLSMNEHHTWQLLVTSSVSESASSSLFSWHSTI